MGTISAQTYFVHFLSILKSWSKPCLAPPDLPGLRQDTLSSSSLHFLIFAIRRIILNW